MSHGSFHQNIKLQRFIEFCDLLVLDVSIQYTNNTGRYTCQIMFMKSHTVQSKMQKNSPHH